MKSLSEWLSWQETLHPEEIELGLERIRRVAARMEVLHHPQARVVTVAGTNGKGSSIAMLDAIARSAGLSVGVYTSPHLLRYNERIVVNGEPVTDQMLCQLFEQVDRARKEERLTYFEFGTLAALALFQQQPLELIILEVGLGGRLDAVNIIDADVALLTTVDLDHQSWLGENRDAIGREKAGIFRSGKAAVVGEPSPPDTVLQRAEALKTVLYRLGVDFRYQRAEQYWCWQGGDGLTLDSLPLPALGGAIQLQNGAAILEVIVQLGWMERIGSEAIRQGLHSVTLAGRFQQRNDHPQLILDVAHNPQAARQLAENLISTPVAGETIAVVGMLRDKERESVVAELSPEVDRWMVAGLEGNRGCTTAEMEKVVKLVADEATVECFDTIIEAYRAALRGVSPAGRILVFGSFITVAAVMALLEPSDGESE
ncbi:MAG: bifunctional tetrahydrofolate synthase/dihydrofolate synthase [Gammaproteobacteria bacterium]|nr:bifunctional tetrahydrofolate synthase/dihydrofolate synthase [Gammaproteobacteria bacterium]MBT7308820.1 bifunctional tetrahydrofolate synthase/dihydrofolate synthase [Gammaproteobacteria bacterium]